MIHDNYPIIIRSLFDNPEYTINSILSTNDSAQFEMFYPSDDEPNFRGNTDYIIGKFQ